MRRLTVIAALVMITATAHAQECPKGMFWTGAGCSIRLSTKVRVTIDTMQRAAGLMKITGIVENAGESTIPRPVVRFVANDPSGRIAFADQVAQLSPTERSWPAGIGAAFTVILTLPEGRDYRWGVYVDQIETEVRFRHEKPADYRDRDRT